ncbi:hypothetical protein TNCV_862861 [Trichonephila clavipes]|nr:hypothetical protein TNCV_862861 [Trichonephila clavipes]
MRQRLFSHVTIKVQLQIISNKAIFSFVGFCNVVFGAACKHHILCFARKIAQEALKKANGNDSSTRGFSPVPMSDNEIKETSLCGFRLGDPKCDGPL